MSKKVIVSVINDLVTDQRVKKVCSTLSEMGFRIVLTGRRVKESLPMDERPYPVHRIKLLFEKGPAFYLCFQLRLFIFLLRHPADLLVANDLDTLLPNFLISRIRKIPLVYDTHEYFTGVPELQNHPLKQKIWKKLEQWLFPKLKTIFTVNGSIAGLYEKEYGIRPVVVRNVPPKFENPTPKSRRALGLPENKFILILQGSGINVHRGAEEITEAMQYLDQVVLLIVGNGDVLPALKKKVAQLSLSEKVIFISRRPYPEMMQYTAAANLGLTLDKDTNINYRYSLPNKIFDYLHAGIPVLASRLPEIEKIIETYHVGDFIPDHNPENMAKKIKDIMAHPNRLQQWKENIAVAAAELNWETESEKLKKVYRQYV